MTDEELDAIEAALRVKLPSDYRRVSVTFPFRPLGRDWVYWFYNDPALVVGETTDPLADGEYDRTGWRDSYVVIGQSACGDLYLLDTVLERSPVYCLSHESHAVEVEWPDFAAFVEEWLQAPERHAEQLAAGREQLRAWWRRSSIIMGIIILFAVVLPLIGLWLLE
jgi:hypothetical protein